MKILARKESGRLVPVDDAGDEVLRAVPHGELLTVEIKQPRNPNHHKLYWALVGIIFNNQERYATPDVLHEVLKVCTGLSTEVELPSGRVVAIPGSISFAKMDQASFKQFFDKVCDVVGKHIIPGLPSETLKRQVEEMTGLKT